MPEGHGSIIPYGKAEHPILEKYQDELLVAGESNQPLEFFEGDWKENAKFALFKFPTVERLKGFWSSEEHQAIKHLRFDKLSLFLFQKDYHFTKAS